MYPQTRLHIQSIWIRLLSLIVLTWLLASCGQEAPARIEPNEPDVADTNGNTGPTEASITQEPEEATTPTEAPVASPEIEEAVSPESEAPPVAAGSLMEEQRALGDPDAPITMVVYSDFQ
ncbi:MAG: hypothetical protein AAGF95_00075 [Chloroflexota bacterium]